MSHWKGRKGGKGGSPPPPSATYEAPNTLRSKSTARILDLISEGEIGGLVNGAESIFFDDVPLENADGTRNFSGVAYEERVGTPTQDHILGFPSTENTVGVSTEVTVAGGPVVRAISDPEADAVRVAIRIPNLTNFDTVGNQLLGYAVAIQIDVAPNGGPYVTAVTDTISGKTTTNYERGYRVELPAGGVPWNVRVTRVSADDASSTKQSKTFWSANTIITDAKLSYPDSALIATTIDAELFGSNIPTRSYEVDLLIVNIPDNYNPVTRVYTGVWAGTFTTAVTDNPAWVLYDLLVTRRYGLGRYIDAAQVDKFGFYAIAQYCDGLVDDGAGGTEPRFTFNQWISSAADAYKAINAIVSAFQAMSFWSTGSVTLAQDSPADPVKLVSPANVIGGEFSYSGSGLKARHSVVLVTWNDPEIAYRTNIEPVEDFDLIRQFGYRVKDVVAYGCTSRGQAKRYGRWILETEKNATEIVQYEASMDHADVRPGDVISVADPTIAGVRFGGRVVSMPTTTTSTLDASVTLALGETYTLNAVLPDGTVEERTVTSASGTHTTLAFTPAFSTDPDPGAMWTVSGTDVAPRQFRVIDVSESAKNRFEITAVLHDPDKYARVEQNLRLEPPSYSLLPTGAILPPTDLDVTEYLTILNGSPSPRATFSWGAAGDGRVQFYEAEVKRPDAGSFEALGVVSSISIDLGSISEGSYTFRVRAVSALGQKSQYAELTLSLFALKAPPSDVVGCSVSVSGSQAILSWTSVSDLDLAGYRIRHHPSPTSPTWSAASFLMEAPATATSAALPALPGSYLIKAVDTSGILSDTECAATSPLSSLATTVDAVTPLSEDPGFTGTKTNTVVDGTSLKLGPGAGGDVFIAEGSYTFVGNPVDLGAKYLAVIEPDLTYTAVDGTSFISDWGSLAAVTSMSGAAPGSVDVIFEVRATDGDPAAAPTWGSWQPVLVVAEIAGRGFEFRVRLLSYDGTSTPLISSLGVNVGLAVRVDFGDDVLSTVGGTTHNFAEAFYATPAISITGQGLGAGEIAVMTNPTKTGFDLNFITSAGANVGPPAIKFDYIAQGPGRKL